MLFSSKIQASIAQRQSVALVMQRFRVQIPVEAFIKNITTYQNIYKTLLYLNLKRDFNKRKNGHRL